jgi:formate/nitrite transporter FocA (FNT family)
MKRIGRGNAAADLVKQIDFAAFVHQYAVAHSHRSNLEAVCGVVQCKFLVCTIIIFPRVRP